MLSAMDAELFDSDLLESCRRDDERESQRVFYLPSLAEIAVMKGQIRGEKEAKEARLNGAPPHLMWREPRVFRTNRDVQRRKHSWVE